VEHADHDVPAVELLPVGQRREREGDVRRLVQAVVGARAGRELAASRPVVGLDVGVDDAGDLRALERGKLQVALDVVGLWVYDRRRLVADSPEDVGCAPGPGIEELLEDHGPPPPAVLSRGSAIRSNRMFGSDR
jgi:hypothetical protein